MNLQKTYLKQIFVLIAIFLGLELISYSGFFWPGLNQAAFFILAISVLILSIYKLEYGLLFVFTELIIGSKGYLFYFPLTSEQLLSIRIVSWSLFMIVFVVKFVSQIYKKRNASTYWLNIKNFQFIKPYLVLFGTVIVGLFSALIYKNNFFNIFLDFNAWLYFLLLFPLIALKPDYKKIANFLLAASIWISIKTLLLLFIFSHNFVFSSTVYSWLRKTLVGEMTILGAWNRVFIQSQIFPIIAYFYFLLTALNFQKFKDFFKGELLINIFLLSLFFSTIIISLSRSFWIGILAAGLFSVSYLVFKKRPYNYKIINKVLLIVALSSLIGLFLIFLATPKGSAKQLEAQLADRVSNQDEPAAASRWSLLPVLLTEIKKNPISGQGFGATVTYYSSDPRVLENVANGAYTTFAFEWGYLDLWLKTGLLGLFAYLWLLFLLIKNALKLIKDNNNFLFLSIVSGLVFLASVNFFTPYLNHPLGIGFILLCSCLISKDRVY